MVKFGGPAFPIRADDRLIYTGMTLRDYFAAKALQGLIANSETDGYKHDYAKWAYEYADEMLKQREKS